MRAEFSKDHDNHPGQSQLILALTGDAKGMRRQLQKIIDDLDGNSAHYLTNKPIQGIYWSLDAVMEVKTPIWNGEPN